MMAAKSSTMHPYAAIDHRVIDSPAFADLSHSSVRLLLLIARQLTVSVTWSKGNNGHLSAAFSECKKRGFGSEHTLRDAIAELISHGFIYRTRSHGANGAWAHYAVTWLPIKETKRLFLDGFVPCAWRNWMPLNKKSSRQKKPEQPGKKCSFTTEIPAESAGSPPAETAYYELVPIEGGICTSSAHHATTPLTHIRRLSKLAAGGRLSPIQNYE
jgi:hypothetical protein